MDLDENKRAKRKNNNFERKNDLAAILDYCKKFEYMRWFLIKSWTNNVLQVKCIWAKISKPRGKMTFLNDKNHDLAAILDFCESSNTQDESS